jgi:hypothetical protein
LCDGWIGKELPTGRDISMEVAVTLQMINEDLAWSYGERVTVYESE